MLRLNQLSGFGGQSVPQMLIGLGEALNTDSPTFALDLGPPGLKQVVAVFACYDILGNDPWNWGTGSVGGEPFTYVIPGGEENAGNGSSFTAGVTIRSLQTYLHGIKTVVGPPIVGFNGVMNETRMAAFVLRGFNPTPLSVDNGDSEPPQNSGNDFRLNTAGARLVVGAAAAASAPGNMQGPGSEVTVIATSRVSIGYDITPAGGAIDIYSFTGAKYTIAGAAFG